MIKYKYLNEDLVYLIDAGSNLYGFVSYYNKTSLNNLVRVNVPTWNGFAWVNEEYLQLYTDIFRELSATESEIFNELGRR